MAKIYDPNCCFRPSNIIAIFSCRCSKWRIRANPPNRMNSPSCLHEQWLLVVSLSLTFSKETVVEQAVVEQLSNRHDIGTFLYTQNVAALDGSVISVCFISPCFQHDQLLFTKSLTFLHKDLTQNIARFPTDIRISENYTHTTPKVFFFPDRVWPLARSYCHWCSNKRVEAKNIRTNETIY